MEVSGKKKGKITPIYKKVNRKTITVLESNLIRSVLVSKYKKWQQKLAKILKVRLADAYERGYKIRYKGSTRLKNGDVLFNSEQVLFYVAQEHNRTAIIVTAEATVTKPSVRGTLTILEKPKEKK